MRSAPVPLIHTSDAGGRLVGPRAAGVAAPPGAAVPASPPAAVAAAAPMTSLRRVICVPMVPLVSMDSPPRSDYLSPYLLAEEDVGLLHALGRGRGAARGPFEIVGQRGAGPFEQFRPPVVRRQTHRAGALRERLD